MEVTWKKPLRSDAASDRSSSSSLYSPERAITASCMPRPCTVSLPARISSTKCWERLCASLTSRRRRAVRAWLSRAMSSSSTPENTAKAPSIQWNMKSAQRKTGVHGASKKAKGPEPAKKRWIASRSRTPVAGRDRSAGAMARVRIARSTRESSLA